RLHVELDHQTLHVSLVGSEGSQHQVAGVAKAGAKPVVVRAGASGCAMAKAAEYGCIRVRAFPVLPPAHAAMQNSASGYPYAGGLSGIACDDEAGYSRWRGVLDK